MTSRGRLLSLSLLLPSLLVVAPAAEADPPSERPAPQLRTAYMVGLDIHTETGQIVHVPLPGNTDRTTTLLGHSDRGWVVEASNKYYVVSGDTATRIGRAAPPATVFPTKVQLSDDGTYVADSHSDYFAYIDTLDLDGRVLDHWMIDGGGDLEDASGDTVYVGAYRALYELTIGEGRRKVARRTPSLVSIEHDTAFFSQDGGRSGPTSLSEPGQARWRTSSRPLSMSPQGSLVATYARPGKIEVLRMSDGKQVRSWRGYCADCFDELAWESERFLLFNTWNAQGTRQALKRCDVRTGRCRLATPWSRYRYSLLGSAHYVLNYRPGFIS